MEVKLTKFKMEKVEVESQILKIPTEPTYYFETHIRRSVRIVPIYTTWLLNQGKAEEEIYRLSITCVYSSFELKIEKFELSINEIENIYYSANHKIGSFVEAFVNGYLKSRTEEQFYSDLNATVSKIVGID